MKKSQNQGFTLIETAIVVLVASLFMLGAIKVYEQYTIEKRLAEFEKTTDTITSAIALYLQETTIYESPPGGITVGGIFYPAGATISGLALDEDGDPIPEDTTAATNGVNESREPTRYPCPANPNAAPGDPTYGVEQRNLATGKCLVTVASGIISAGAGDSRVYYGSIPTVTLGIPARNMYDPYFRRFTYAVSHRVSDSNPNGIDPISGQPRPDGGAMGDGLNPPGSIRITDGDTPPNTLYNNVHFAIVAHGSNAAGAANVNGNIETPCNAANTGRDIENCDHLTATPDRIFMDANEDRSANHNDPSWYDDTIIYTLRGINDKEEYWGTGTNTTDTVMLNTGNVGIGEALPTEKVDVAGRVRAHSFLHASDKRLKKNIKPLKENSLEKLTGVDIVTYDYKDTPEKHRKIGVIAQDLEKIYPEFVFEGKNGYLSVDYVSLTAPIIKALQELSSEKNAEIQRLNKELSNLTKRLEAIENKSKNNHDFHNKEEIRYNE